MRDAGYALIHRTLLDHPAFNDEPEAWAFASLILRAAWKPTRTTYCGFEVVLERGQAVISVRDFASKWGWSKSKADRFFQRLERDGMIKRKRDTTGTATGTATGTPANVITICNYDKFQTVFQSDGTLVGQQDFQSGTQNNTKKTTPSKDNNKLLSKGSPTGRASAWSENQRLPQEWLTWAMAELGWSKTQAQTEAQRFIDSALAKRRTYVDWRAAWRQWCRSPFQKTVGAKQEALTL